MKIYNDIHKYMWVCAIWLFVANSYWVISGDGRVLLYIIPLMAVLILDWRHTYTLGVSRWYLVAALLFPPIYLIARAIKLRKQGGNIYIVVLLASFFVPNIIYQVAYGHQALEDSACNVVSDLLSKNLSRADLSCKVVRIKDDVGKGFYIAGAVLNSGNEIKITIQENDGGQIWVEIPSQIIR
jgi:hypothetical protein